MNNNKELIETLKKTLKALEHKEKKKSLKQRVRELETEVERLRDNETQEKEYVIIDRFTRRHYFKKSPINNRDDLNKYILNIPRCNIRCGDCWLSKQGRKP